MGETAKDKTLAESRPHRRTPFAAIAVAVAVFAAIATIIVAPLGSAVFRRDFDDIAEAVVAALAGGAAFWRARRTHPRFRRTWYAIACGCTSWALGEVYWSWKEIGGYLNPFPSFADLGYLLFPAGIGVALVLYPTPAGRGDRERRAVDSLMVSASLFLLSWNLVLGGLVGTGRDDLLKYTVGLAYPVSDVVMLVMTVLTLMRTAIGRWSLALLGAGIISFCCSDSAFVALTSTDDYTGGLVDLGWYGGFLLIALAALTLDDAEHQVTAETPRAMRASSVLPYVPMFAALLSTAIELFGGSLPNRAQLTLSAAIITLLFFRQYRVVADQAALAGELAEREAQLHHQVFHDSLTGLANRALFHNRLAHALELHSRDLRPVAVIFVDLDDFKLVNDTLGHAAGDELLVRAGERLTGAVRNGDTLARLGGDEFAVLIEDEGEPASVATRMFDALRTPFPIGDSVQQVSASIGIVEVGSDDVTASADQLLARADTAMYAAKRAGKARIELHHAGMALPEMRDLQLAEALTQAMARGEIFLAYQPIVNLDDGSVLAFESLARWTCDGAIIAPSEFIPLAERTGLIGELTAYVLHEVCQQLASWTRAYGRRGLAVTINVPPQEISRMAFYRLVRSHLDEHGLDPSQLVIEITESGLMENSAGARATIEALRRLGVRVVLDDFGVGFSSLSQLNSVPLDWVKIDKSFLANIDSDPRQTRFLNALIRLGHDLKLVIVAEGVERPEQRDELDRHGCTYAQGYLFARPMPPTDVPAFLQAAAQTRRAALPAQPPESIAAEVMSRASDATRTPSNRSPSEASSTWDAYDPAVG